METYRKFLLNEQMPCDGCIHASACGANKRACLAFALYVDKGIDNWTLPRVPTTKTYFRIMNNDDIALRRDVNEQLRNREVA